MKLSRNPSSTEKQRAKQEALDLIAKGRASAAARLMRDLLDAVPGEFDALHLLGLARFREGKIEEAVDHLERAAAMRPNAPAVWLNLAGALHGAGRAGDAVTALERAAALEPHKGEINQRLCVALLDAGRSEDAVARATCFTETEQASDLAHTTLGIVLARLDRHEEAIAGFRQALMLKPDSLLALGNLGASLASLQRHGEAAEVLARYVAHRPDDAPLLEKLIMARRAIGDLEGLDELERQLQAARKH